MINISYPQILWISHCSTELVSFQPSQDATVAFPSCYRVALGQFASSANVDLRRDAIRASHGQREPERKQKDTSGAHLEILINFFVIKNVTLEVINID